MRVVDPPARVQELLAEFGSLGGVLHHVCVELEGAAPEEKSVHREAALLGLQKVQRDTDRYFENLLRRDEYEKNKREDFFRMEIDPSLLEGKAISLQDFLGSHFDLESRRLILKSWAPDLEEAYAYAFAETPHGLRGTAVQVNDLFRGFVDHLFNGFPEPRALWKWSTDCSNYFDAGREWWGTFFWTLHFGEAPFIVVVLGSTTD